nr:hypothetical protein [uncultured Actinoplanes sp.]
MLRIVDGLGDAAAEVVTSLGGTMPRTPLATAPLGDETVHRGPARSMHYGTSVS